MMAYATLTVLTAALIAAIAKADCNGPVSVPVNILGDQYTATSLCTYTNPTPSNPKSVYLDLFSVVNSARATNASAAVIAFNGAYFGPGVFLDVRGMDSYEDTLALSQAGAPVALLILIEGCTFAGVVSGPLLQLRGYITLLIDPNHVANIPDDEWDALPAPSSYTDTINDPVGSSDTLLIRGNNFSSIGVLTEVGTNIASSSLVLLKSAIIANRTRLLFIANNFEFTSSAFDGIWLAAVSIQFGTLTHGSQMVFTSSNTVRMALTATNVYFGTAAFLLFMQTDYVAEGLWEMAYNSSIVNSVATNITVEIAVATSTASFAAVVTVSKLSINVRRGSLLELCNLCIADIAITRVGNPLNGVAFLHLASGTSPHIEVSEASVIRLSGGSLRLASVTSDGSPPDITVWRNGLKRTLSILSGSSMEISHLDVAMNVVGAGSTGAAVCVRLLAFLSYSGVTIQGNSTAAVNNNIVNATVDFPHAAGTSFDVLYAEYNFDVTIGTTAEGSTNAGSNTFSFTNNAVTAQTNTANIVHMNFFHKENNGESTSLRILSVPSGEITGALVFGGNRLTFRSTNTLAAEERFAVYDHGGQINIAGAYSSFTISGNVVSYSGSATSIQHYTVVAYQGGSGWHVDGGSFALDRHAQTQTPRAVPGDLSFLWMQVSDFQISNGGRWIVSNSVVAASTVGLTPVPNYVNMGLFAGLTLTVSGAGVEPVMIMENVVVEYDLPCGQSYRRAGSDGNPTIVYWSSCAISDSSPLFQPLTVADSSVSLRLDSSRFSTYSGALLDVGNFNTAFGTITLTRSVFEATDVSGAAILNATTGLGTFVANQKEDLLQIYACNVSLRDASGVVPILNSTVLNAFSPPPFGSPSKAFLNCSLATTPTPTTTTTQTTATTTTPTPTTTTTQTTATTTTPTPTTTTTQTTATTTTPTPTTTTTQTTATTTTPTPTATSTTTTVPPPTCDGISGRLWGHITSGLVWADPGVKSNATIPFETWSPWYNRDTKTVLLRLRSNTGDVAFANYSMGEGDPCSHNYGWAVQGTQISIGGQQQEGVAVASFIYPPNNQDPQFSYVDIALLVPEVLVNASSSQPQGNNSAALVPAEVVFHLVPRGGATGQAVVAEDANSAAASPSTEACCNVNVTFTLHLAPELTTTTTAATPAPYIPRDVEQGTGVVIVVGGGLVLPGVALQQGNGMALLRMSTCRDDSIGDPLPQLVHPLYFPLGDDDLKYYRGSVVGNVFVIPIVFGLLCRFFAVPVVGLVNLKVGLPSAPEDVMDLMGWPSVMVIPFVVTVEGTTASGVRLGQLGTAGDAVLGAFGVGAPVIVAALWIIYMKLRLPLKNLKLITNPCGLLGVKVHQAMCDAAVEDPLKRVPHRPMWLWQLFHPVYEWEVVCDTVKVSGWLLEEAEEEDSIPVLLAQRQRATSSISVNTVSDEAAKGDEAEEGFVDVERIEGIRDYLNKAAMEAAFNRGEHCVGEYWFIYSEWLGLCMGIIVGICEGVLPTTDTMCVARIAVAFTATFTQCTLILCMLVPAEALLMLGGSILVIIVAGAAVAVAAGADGQAQLQDILKDSASSMVILGALTMVFGVVRWVVRVVGRMEEVEERRVRRRGVTVREPETPLNSGHRFSVDSEKSDSYSQAEEEEMEEEEVETEHDYNYYEPLGDEADNDEEINLDELENAMMVGSFS